MNCERCKNKLSHSKTSDRRPIPVTYGETDMTICYRCAVELTVVIGHWLGTEPQENPKAWVRELVKAGKPPTPPTPPISKDIPCAHCGHESKIILMDPDDFEDGMFAPIFCVECGEPTTFHFEGGEIKAGLQ